MQLLLSFKVALLSFGQSYEKPIKFVAYLVQSMLAVQLVTRRAKQTATVSLNFPDSKIQGANMGPTSPTWVPLVPNWRHVGPMHLAIRVVPLDMATS